MLRHFYQLMGGCLRHALVVLAVASLALNGVCLSDFSRSCAECAACAAEQIDAGQHEGDCTGGIDDSCQCVCYHATDIPTPQVAVMPAEGGPWFRLPVALDIAESAVRDIDLPPIIA